MRLEQVKTSDVPAQRVEALVSSALASAPDEAAQKRLAQIGQGTGGLLDSLFNMNDWGKVDLHALQNVLSAATAIAYDRWAQLQLDEIRGAIADRAADLQDASEEGLVRVLLQVVYAERAGFDGAHKRRVSFGPRLPLNFLALPLMTGMRPDGLREVILDQFASAIDARENTWGRQGLTRIGQYRLSELDGDFYAGLAEQLGQATIQEVEDQPISALDADLQAQVQRYLGMRGIEGQRLGDLEFYEELAQHLQRETLALLVEPGVVLGEEIAGEMQEYLFREGHFEDATLKETLLSKPLADLDEELQEGIAIEVGNDSLQNLKEVPMAEWDPEVRNAIIEYLRGRGHFVDEEKVQQFFVHGTLGDLEEQLAQDACAYIVERRLAKLGNRSIGALKGELQESILGYLQRQGLLVDPSKRQLLERQTLAELDEPAFTALSIHLGQRELDAVGVISALPEKVRRDLQQHLVEIDHFTDEELQGSFLQGKSSDLPEPAYEGLKEHLLKGLEQDLNQKLIGELDPRIQEVIHDHLGGTDYFLDEAKVSQFGNLTVASLDIGVVHELEQELGDGIVAELEERKFMNLDQETRESILSYLDMEGLFKKKKKRDQFVKGSLGELEKGMRDGIAYHLGRNRLTEYREAPFADIPDALRNHIWRHLRDNGYFFDKEKEEYLEIEEVSNLDEDLRSGIRSALREDLEQLLSERGVVDLPQDMKASVEEYLAEQDYFLDHARLAQFESSKPDDLDSGTLAVTCQYLGQRALAEVQDQKLSELRDGLRQEIEGYLEGTEFFVDEAKKKKFMQRRVADLDDEIFDGLVQSLGGELAAETVTWQVAKFDESDRESLRDYLDSVGYFLDQAALSRFEQGMLGDLNLDKRDHERLASLLGRRWLYDNAGQRLTGLGERLREDIESHLRLSGHFLNNEKLEHFQERGLSGLDENTQADLLRYMWHRREQAIKQQRLADLDDHTRHSVESFLTQKGFGLDEQGMAQYKDTRLRDLDDDLRKGLARYLGYQRLNQATDSKISDLDEADRSQAQRYLGMQLMQQIEKNLMLGFISRLWVDYLTAIEDLRQGIGLQAYGQMDPLVEYKRRAFRMFGELNDNINRMVVTNVFRYPPQPLRLAQAGE